MKYKILIYGTGMICNQFISDEIDWEKVEILAYIETKKRIEVYKGRPVITPEHIRKYDYDILVVANSYAEEIYPILKENDIPMKNVIFFNCLWYARIEEIDFISLCKFKDMLNKYGYLHSVVEFYIRQYHTHYVLIECKQMKFLGNVYDWIMTRMVLDGKCYASQDIDIFLELSRKYYDLDMGGYFVDCGCNILTTTVYVLNKDLKLKALAFEPVLNTYQIACANVALNSLGDRVTVVNKGLSDQCGSAYIKYDKYNCGSSTIVNEVKKGDESLLPVQMTTFDEYCNQNQFCIDDIAYIWIDSEGFEGFVIEGMRAVLERKKVPLFLEFNDKMLQQHGCYDLLVKNLKTYYKGFIEISGIAQRYREISEIRTLKNVHTNLFLIS